MDPLDHEHDQVTASGCVDKQLGEDVPDPIAASADAAPADPPGTVVADANEPAGSNEPALPARWHAVFAPEGIKTGDGRMIAQGALGARPMPLPLQYTDETPHGGIPSGAHTVGQIDLVERRDNYIYAEGTYDLDGEWGREAARMCANQMVRYISMDLTDCESEWVSTGDSGGEDDLLDLLFGEPDGYMLITKANIAAATQLPIPAFYQAVIAPIDVELDLSTLPEPPEQGPLGLAAAGLSLVVDVPQVPSADWFADPHLERPTHLTVTDDGRVFGHLATWDQAHVGLPGQVYAPHSQSGYAYFRTGVMRADTADGPVDVATGVLTMGTGHAGSTLRHRPAADHYDNTGSGVADVAAGEDDHGIWVAGALRPGVTVDQVRILRASDVSGDWRTIGGHLELVAALVVNVPGFPIPGVAASGVGAEILVAAARGALGVVLDSGRPRLGEIDGQQVSLVAAGMVHRNPIKEAMARLAKVVTSQGEEIRLLRAIVEPLRPLVAERLAVRAGATA